MTPKHDVPNDGLSPPPGLGPFLRNTQGVGPIELVETFATAPVRPGAHTLIQEYERAAASYGRGPHYRAGKTVLPPASRPVFLLVASGRAAGPRRRGRIDCTCLQEIEAAVDGLSDCRLGLRVAGRGHRRAAGPHDRVPSLAFQLVGLADFRLGRAADQDRFPVVAFVDSVRVPDALRLGLAVAA